MSDIKRVEYTQATLCFPVQGNEVLLAEKQKKIGAGFLNGFGGKSEPKDNSVWETNARETEEEVGIKIQEVKKVGEIIFHNLSKDPELSNIMGHIFIATKWSGTPKETNEMKKIAWYNIDELDYEKFLPGDRFFIPKILNGKLVKGTIEYNSDWSVQTANIQEVDRF